MVTDWNEKAKKDARLLQRKIAALNAEETKETSNLTVLVWCYFFLVVCSVFSGVGVLVVPLTVFFLLPVLVISVGIDIYKTVKKPYFSPVYSLRRLFFSWKTFWILVVLLMVLNFLYLFPFPFFLASMVFLACYIIFWMIVEFVEERKN